MTISSQDLGALEQLRRLQRVTDATLGHLSVEELLDELLGRVREILSAYTVAVLFLDPDTNELVARAAVGLEEEVHRGVRIPVGRGFAGRIAAERRPLVIRRVDHRNVLNPILREKGVRSLLGVPLLARGNVLGVLHVGTLTERDFSPGDVELLQLVAERVAMALYVRLYERERLVTESLQRTFLPEALPNVPGMSMASRYVPAVRSAAVGGDWYDAFALPDGHVALVIGDVAGHGITASSVMGRTRNSLRAYALEGSRPGELLVRLDRMLEYFDPGHLVTVLFGLVDPGMTSFRFASAGHVPPLVVDADGPRFLGLGADDEADPPLGGRFGHAYRDRVAPLAPGSVLMLYTDGLVERRNVSLDVTLERLRTVVGSWGDHDPSELVMSVVREMLGSERPTDDVALLVLRLHPAPAAAPTITVPARPEQLAVVRRRLRRWLARLPIPGRVADDVITAVGEACANAIEHAYGPAGGPLHVELSFEDRTIEVSVRDEGRWRRSRTAGRGRGLTLMRAFMDSVEIERSAGGSVVRMRRAVMAS